MPRFHHLLIATALSFGLIGAPMTGYAQAQPQQKQQQQQTGQGRMFVKPGVTLNGRKGPGTGYGKMAAIPAGTSLTLVKRQGDWAQVKSSEGVLLWVFMNYLTQSAPQKAQPQKQQKQHQQQQQQPMPSRP